MMNIRFQNDFSKFHLWFPFCKAHQIRLRRRKSSAWPPFIQGQNKLRSVWMLYVSVSFHCLCYAVLTLSILNAVSPQFDSSCRHFILKGQEGYSKLASLKLEKFYLSEKSF